ncbi:SUF system NifU family Fe-S cluster assembly protein [Dehalococcoidia bacterium]|nr:SUF system NifU family Fe-S cluster assembly protein [Dehalococcoidia bacterium]
MQLDEIDNLYYGVILDHYKNPRNLYPLVEAQIQAKELNPFCGDEVALQLKLSCDGVIQQVGSQAQGCFICRASASLLSEALEGMNLGDTELLNRSFRVMMAGEELSVTECDTLGDLAALKAVRKFPVRIKCAMLAWATLEEGLREYQGRGQQ